MANIDYAKLYETAGLDTEGAAGKGLTYAGTPEQIKRVEEVYGIKNASGTTSRTPQYNEAGAPITNNNASTSLASNLSESDFNAKYGLNYEQTREQVLKAQQARIDAINQVYANLKAQEETRQAEAKKMAMGQTRATAARGGLLGSSFGEAQLAGTSTRADEAARAALGELSAKQNAEVQAVYSDIDKQALEMAKANREAALGNFEAYQSYLTNARNMAQTTLSAAAKSGKGLDEYKSALGETAFKQLLDNAGLDETAAQGFFEANKNITEPVKVGDALVNPRTGEVIYQAPVGEKLPETQVVTAGGRSLLINKQTGETIKDIGSAYKGGTGGSSAEPGKLSGKFTEEELAQRAEQYINDDGSVDWLSLDALENVNKDLWNDMRNFLGNIQSQVPDVSLEEEPSEPITAEGAGESVGKAAGNIVKATQNIYKQGGGIKKYVAGKIIEKTSPTAGKFLSGIKKGLGWLAE